MNVSVYIEIKEEFRKEAVYTFENLFYPFFNKINFSDDINEFLKNNNKIIYCLPESKILNNPEAVKNSIVIFLEEETLAYFSTFEDYDINEILYIDSTPCLFPCKKKPANKDFNVFPFDLVASSFFFLSCWQEYTIKERDARNRIPFASTIHRKLNFGRQPIVNLYLKIFEDYMEKSWNTKLVQRKKFGGKKIFVALTHDLDVVQYKTFPYLTRLLFDMRKYINLSIKNIYYIFRNSIGQKYILQKLEEIEMKFKVRSSHYFLSEYPKKDKFFVKKYVKRLKNNNFEIGHHISNTSIFGNNLNEDKNMIRYIDTDIIGSRVHMLEFEIKPLFNQLEEQNYNYDTSLMFAEEFSYRTGFSFPHYIFNISEKKPYQIVEIPLNVMDISSNKYLDLKDEEFEKALFSFINSSKKFGGAVTLLFHNSYFFFNTHTRLKLYNNLLSSLKKQQIPIGTCEELYLWRKN